MIGKQRRPHRSVRAATIVSLALAGAALAPRDTTALARNVRAMPTADIALAAGAADITDREARSTTGLYGHAARSVSVDDTGHLHLLKAYGSVLLEEGYAGGTLPGQAKVRLVVGSTVAATFSIQTKYGTIYGSGSAALHSSGRYASFGGSLSVNHGSGSYARAHGAGRLYGVIDRRTSALTVQTVGTLSY